LLLIINNTAIINCNIIFSNGLYEYFSSKNPKKPDKIIIDEKKIKSL
jgi:hypothetical protein